MQQPASWHEWRHLTSIRQGHQCISAQSTSKARASERRRSGCGLQHGQDMQCCNTLSPAERAIPVTMDLTTCLHKRGLAPSTTRSSQARFKLHDAQRNGWMRHVLVRHCSLLGRSSAGILLYCQLKIIQTLRWELESAAFIPLVLGFLGTQHMAHFDFRQPGRLHWALALRMWIALIGVLTDH